MITTIPLVTGDYAILSVNSSSATSLSKPGGLYMTTIFYNKTDISNQILLYQITFFNASFFGLYCDLAPNNIGYMCIVETSYNNSQTLQTTYMKIQFLTSESVTSIDLLSSLPPNISSLGVTSPSIGMQAMVFGGYIFYAMAKNQEYYIWTYDESSNNTGQFGPYPANKYAANPIFNNRFKPLHETNKTEYFKALLQDISEKLPIRPELLTIEYYQYISKNSIENLQFLIRVNTDLGSNLGVVSDLNIMIKHKRITTFSNGLANDLDGTYGFQPQPNIFDNYKKEIIIFFITAAMNFLLYVSTQSSKSKSNIEQKINLAAAGLFVFNQSSFSGIFAFSSASSYPKFSSPSRIIWVIPIAINIILLSYIMHKGGFNQLTFMKSIIILLILCDCEILLLINQKTIDEIFGEKFEKFKIIARRKAFVDILIKNIPQLIILVKVPLLMVYLSACQS
ncbi:5130_t:CDS:2 [Gigaspora margarita]|uniref:5130_t:CDS:1 n=1 Tax=Gigaspora margarita TaxID=4874 RepID=A0ABM8W5E6_GIGMA|nr:5130_t:CDS:2 [Gigaspora margarita]